MLEAHLFVFQHLLSWWYTTVKMHSLYVYD